MPSTVVKTYGARGIQRLGRWPIAASQTFKAGDYLNMNSSGQAQQAIAATGSDATAWSSSCTNLILGRATEDAQPSTNDPSIIPSTKLYVEFIIAEPGTQFELPLWHTTATSAYFALTNSTIGYNFSYRSVTGNAVWVVNIGATNAPMVQIDDVFGDYLQGWPDLGQTALATTGTLAQYASVWGQFLGGTCAFSGARPLTRTN